MKKIIIALGLILALNAGLNAKIIAHANGKDISSQELNKAAELFLGGRDILTLSKQEQERVVKMYVVQQAIIAAAKRDKLEHSKLFMELMSAARDNALADVYQDNILKKIKISDKKAKEFYNMRKEAFMMPARVKVRQLVLATKSQANEALKKLKGLKGAALISTFSKLDIKAHQNNSTWMSLKSMPKNFSSELIKLKLGSYNKKALKSEFGYHIFLKEAYEPKQQLSFAEVKQNIIANLKNEEFAIIMAKKAADIVEKAKIEFKN